MTVRLFGPRPAHRTIAICLVLACAVLTLVGGSAVAQQITMPLWPHGTPEPAQTTAPEADGGVPVATFPTGHRASSLANVTVPTLSVYPPHKDANGGAALVFPGGGYQHLAWTKEGLDTCDWLNSIGMTCLLVKYRVPEPKFTDNKPDSHADLEDAQQAIRLARAHAAEWHLDPGHIGVIGYSAGGNLATLLGIHPNDDHIGSTPAAADVPGVHGRMNGTPMLTDPLSARPDFAILVYPAYLAVDPGQTDLDPAYTPTAATPPTFLTAAEDDKIYGRNALVYYRALLEAHIPAELHFFPYGGHGFGTFPKGAPAHWTDMAASWLRLIGMVQIPAGRGDSSQPVTAGVPCPHAGDAHGWTQAEPAQPEQPAGRSKLSCAAAQLASCLQTRAGVGTLGWRRRRRGVRWRRS